MDTNTSIVWIGFKGLSLGKQIQAPLMSLVFASRIALSSV